MRGTDTRSELPLAAPEQSGCGCCSTGAQTKALPAAEGAGLVLALSACSPSSGTAGPSPAGSGTGGKQAQANPSGTVLATYAVSGEPVPSAGPLPAQPAPRDLRSAAVTARRELTFAMRMRMGMGMGSGMSFTFNGKPFDPGRIDSTVPAGALEERTLTNMSPMDYPFHLHLWPMQIIEQTGGPVADPEWQDAVNVPARSSVRVRIAFDDFTAKTVYHCHILDHEDSGMMGLIESQ